MMQEMHLALTKLGIPDLGGGFVDVRHLKSRGLQKKSFNEDYSMGSSTDEN